MILFAVLFILISITEILTLLLVIFAALSYLDEHNHKK